VECLTYFFVSFIVRRHGHVLVIFCRPELVYETPEERRHVAPPPASWHSAPCPCPPSHHYHAMCCLAVAVPPRLVFPGPLHRAPHQGCWYVIAHDSAAHSLRSP
jgi:hypothetical protein